MGSLDRAEWEVRPCPLKDAQAFIKRYHYARGGSNTAVYTHGLYRRGQDTLCGVVWWLPPTRVAAESVNRGHWQKVLSLSRMAVLPDCPKNSCSFMLAKSIGIIRRERRFVTLVTYADESQGHTGNVYRASGWTYVGKTGPYLRWLDRSGRQVSAKATRSRTVAQMEALGYVRGGRFFKHKYVRCI